MPEAPLDLFLPPVAEWFHAKLGAPSRAQALGWPPIARGESTLLLAPTGSGKTLAAFLVAIDRLFRRDAAHRSPPATRVLYVSPLKALAVDVERNLRSPIAGIVEHAAGAGISLAAPSIDVRTGDTPAKDRARMRRTPGDILITTPESLYLLLTSAGAAALGSVETIIVDEIHAVVPTKRGAHLALSIERLEALRARSASPLQRIGLSATQRPLDEVARFLGGLDDGVPRPVTIVDAGARKTLEIAIETAAPDFRSRTPGNGVRGEASEKVERTVWPAIHTRAVELARRHRTTLVFVNSRGVAERFAAAMNEIAGEEIALAHHGSLAREKRTAIEDRLKRGELRAIVATSSLELGIDMGTIDLVIQIEAPPSIASGLQRIGRACHGIGGVPRGVLLPKHRHDLVACAAAAESMRNADVEETSYPRNPLDVLAQQVVAMSAVETLSVEDLFVRVRRAAPFSELPRAAFEGVLDMLSGRYPSDDFAELRPRITWDRIRGVVTARTNTKKLAVLNAGTIPDRGLYAVFVASEDGGSGGRRVGELDEEMVFELRHGEVFLLGASSWRTEQITHDRVVVSPAAGEPGKMPFWHGDRAGRARAFGVRIGALVRRVAHERVPASELRETYALDDASTEALLDYVRRQVQATGEVPSDRTTLVERFVDDVGDWRVVVLCPLGTRVLAPWAIAVAARLREKYADVDLIYTDDGIAFRIPACEEPPPAAAFFPSPEEIESMVTSALRGTALFAARFRECASRALLLARRDPRRRTPLWAQRKRASDLLAVASRHPSFPIVLETYRECLRDVFDLPGLTEHLRAVSERRVRTMTVDSRSPSPFAASVLFSFVASFIYDGDAPTAERRTQALTIDVARLRELLGDAELRRLLDAAAIDEHEGGLQRLSRPAATADAIHDMVLAVGDLSRAEIAARTTPREAADRWVDELVDARRIVPIGIFGVDRLVAVEDAAKYRDALDCPLPAGLPPALLTPAPNAARDLVARYARTHGPFLEEDVAARLGLDRAAIDAAVATLVDEGRIVRGAFMPGGTREELCDRDVLDAVRRKSLAKLRRAVEPVDVHALARFLPEWQGVVHKRRGRDALLAVVSELQGCPLIVSSLESATLPARIEEYGPWDLDALCASGEVVWSGVEPIGASDGRVALYLAEHEATLARSVAPVDGPLAAAIRTALAERGAIFFAELARRVGGFPGDTLEALWSMVWAGEITNDTFEPLRSRAHARQTSAAGRSSPSRSRSRNALARRAPPSMTNAALASRARLPGSEGRWSLRAARWTSVPGETDKRAAVARALLDRYGVVTRETAHAEGIPGGFSAVYEVLKTLEERGSVRRGYFIEGRGGAQFAVPGADERLRALRHGKPDQVPLVLAADDPANVWGALVDWPSSAAAERPQRAAGALVVLHDGALLGWLGGRRRRLLTFLPAEPAEREPAARLLASALATLADGSRKRVLLVSEIDGAPAAESDLAAAFARTGFTRTARGLLLIKRPPPSQNAGERRTPSSP